MPERFPDKSYHREPVKPSLSNPAFAHTHRWTSDHDKVIDYHFDTGHLPHIETHTKEEAKGWARNVSRVFTVVEQCSLVASFVAILLHHDMPQLEAKKLTLDISHLLGDVSQFSNVIGGLWDEFKLHEKQEVDSTTRTGRALANVARQHAIKNYTLKLAEQTKEKG